MTVAVAVLGTVAVYVVADRVAGRLGRPAWAAPVLWTSVILVVALTALDLAIADYVHDARPLRWLLGPATVALGVPLARAVRTLGRRRAEFRVAGAVLLGGFVTSAVAGLVAAAVGASDEVVAIAAAKSVSTPIAVATDLPIPVDDGLLAASCVVAGLAGALLLPALGCRLRMDDDRPLGTGVGVTSHAIGTAELRRRAPGAVGWAAAGLALNGVSSALWLGPILDVVLPLRS
jgi:putative effector of murein hydrolase